LLRPRLLIRLGVRSYYKLNQQYACAPRNTSFKKAISKSLFGSLPNIFLKAKSTKGSIYFPVTGGLFLGIAKDKSLFHIHRHREGSPRRDKK
jgi:hypothetical protein